MSEIFKTCLYKEILENLNICGQKFYVHAEFFRTSKNENKERNGCHRLAFQELFFCSVIPDIGLCEDFHSILVSQYGEIKVL